MEDRDGFLTLTRKRIEAAVATNGHPGIMVAHSMGNVVFREFIQKNSFLFWSSRSLFFDLIL